jgi:hypothetical protein
MTSVYQDRANALDYKKAIEREELRRKELEKQILSQEIDNQKKAEERNELEEYLVSICSTLENEAASKHNPLASQRKK